MQQKPLKICVLAAARSSHTYLQCGILQDFGHHVTLVSPDDGKCPDGVRHVPCAISSDKGILGKLRWLKAIYNGVKSVEADVYHAHYAAELTTWMAWLLGKKPFIISCLGGDVLFDEQGTLGPIGRWITKRALKKCDHVTVVSNHLGKTVERFGVPRSKIQRVIWGVNHEIFHPEGSTQQTRCLWGVTEDAQIIFSPRMLKPFYNQMMMLDALKEVVQHNPKSVLVFATYNQDANYRKNLEARTKELNLEDHVRYAPPMNQQEMMLAYNSADLVISLSPSDGTPVSVMEAMACGTPVLMADLERYKEFFAHKETGWFTKIETSHVVTAILELFKDQQSYETLRTKGIALIKEKADLHSQSRLLEETSYHLIEHK
ncbi:glycosyltransferase family 4 protein [Kiloniella sp.]|uniref:glycosyltransferase family 4 protein n=1 Tax=Kiloniella sp. TaxID=1938587 RepID=UPI003A90D0AA